MIALRASYYAKLFLINKKRGNKIKNLICMSIGGLCNRLRPLSSCYKTALSSQRKMSIWWVRNFRCDCEFSDLFENEIESINACDILNLDQMKIYAHSYASVQKYAKIENETISSEIFNKFPRVNIGGFLKDINHLTEKNVMVLNDRFMEYGNIERDFLWNLRPTEDIRQKVSEIISNLNIDNNVIGVHARGSDFAESFRINSDYYAKQMQVHLDRDKSVRFLVCSDDHEYEDELAKRFPNNSIKLRDGKKYMCRFKDNKGLQNNIHMSTDAMKESVIDLFLLASCNLIIGHKSSSFYQVSCILNDMPKEKFNANIS